MSSLMHQSRTQYVYDFSSLDAVPEGPTSAVVEPAGAVNETPRSTGTPGTYANVTSSNPTSWLENTEPKITSRIIGNAKLNSADSRSRSSWRT